LRAAAEEEGSASSTAPSSSSSSGPRTSEQLAADQQIAQAALLRLSDFPSGWESTPRDPSTSDTPELQAATNKFAGCLGVNPSLLGDGSDSAEAEAKSDKFTDSHDLEVESTATVSTSSEQAAAVNLLKQPSARGCFQDFVTAALSDALAHPDPGEELPKGVTIGDPDVGQLNLPDLHGESVVYRATLPVSAGALRIKLFMDFAFASKGRTGLFLSFLNVGDPFPQDLEVQLTNTSIDRAPAS
jgi:hypothetical protein